MRRILVILILVVLLVLSSSPSTVGTSDQPVEDYNTSFVHNTPFDLSSAGDSGTGLTADLYASRTISGLDLSIQNSYASVNTHAGDIDLSGYQISGWNLYKVVVDSTLITATPERESTQITQNSYIQIRNNTGLVSDALYQEFYNQPHDGKLDNYTIIYIAPYYTISLGKAYLVVRSDYTDSSTNETSWTSPFSQGLTDTTLTHDVSSDNAVLNQSTPYYVVLDGTAMTGVYAGGWFFNQLYWRSSSSVLGDETGYHLRGDAWFQYTGISREEEFLDYTYTPWNKTGSSALTYSDPSAISLTGNSFENFKSYMEKCPECNKDVWVQESKNGNLYYTQFDSRKKNYKEMPNWHSEYCKGRPEQRPKEQKQTPKEESKEKPKRSVLGTVFPSGEETTSLPKDFQVNKIPLSEQELMNVERSLIENISHAIATYIKFSIDKEFKRL